MVSSLHRLLLLGALAVLPLTTAVSCGEDSVPVCDAPQAWVGAWAAAPSDLGATFSDQTLRLVVAPLRGGDVARVRLSNRFGTAPLTFQNVHLGLQLEGAELVPGSNTPVFFGGLAEVTLEAGADIVSDPVELSFEPFTHLAISLFVPAPGGGTQHNEAYQTSFYTTPGSGDLTAQDGSSGFDQTTASRPFVFGVDVLAPADHSVVVVIGDSITDGSQIDAANVVTGYGEEMRYPDHLGRRLLAAGSHVSPLNLGIGGNRILNNGILPWMGPALLNRLELDVLSRPDVTDVILLEGINDLVTGATSDEVIAGLEAAVAALEAQRPGREPLRVFVGTLTPASGTLGAATFIFSTTERRRQEVNAFIRGGTLGAGYIDFDSALQDPSDPTRLASEYDGGDGLHPSAAGYERMAAEVDLSAFQGGTCPP